MIRFYKVQWRDKYGVLHDAKCQGPRDTRGLVDKVFTENQSCLKWLCVKPIYEKDKKDEQ